MLFDRNLPGFIVCVLFDSYSRQPSRAVWNSCYTDFIYFCMSPIWDVDSPGFRRICTTWNIGVRTVLKLPFNTHLYF